MKLKNFLLLSILVTNNYVFSGETGKSYFNSALEKIKSGNYREANELLHSSYKILEDHPRVEFFLAYTYHLLGDKKQCKVYAEKAYLKFSKNINSNEKSTTYKSRSLELFNWSNSTSKEVELERVYLEFPVKGIRSTYASPFNQSGSELLYWDINSEDYFLAEKFDQKIVSDSLNNSPH